MVKMYDIDNLAHRLRHSGISTYSINLTWLSGLNFPLLGAFVSFLANDGYYTIFGLKNQRKSVLNVQDLTPSIGRRI